MKYASSSSTIFNKSLSDTQSVPETSCKRLGACCKSKTPWPESASELYRPSDHRLSAKLVITFSGYRVPRGQRDGSLRPYSRFCRQEPLLVVNRCNLNEKNLYGHLYRNASHPIYSPWNLHDREVFQSGSSSNLYNSHSVIWCTPNT
jgi:hypothetical protein